MERVEATIGAAIDCQEPLLRRMVADLVAAGGKRLRPRIALLSFDACGGTDEAPVVDTDASGAASYRSPRLGLNAVIDAAAAFELIHTASLVHDDIIDQSPLRRGRPTVHVTYGIPHAIVAGDFLFTQGFALSGRLPKELIAVTAEVCVRLAEGEVMEQRLLAEEVDEEQYLKIIAKKTAEPIRACAMTGAILANADPETVRALGAFGLDLGIAFQIADDVLDIAGDPRETGKAVGQDAKAGVLTLPVGLGEDAAAFRAMARNLDADELRARLEAAGAIDKARAVAGRYAARARDRLARLPAGPSKEALMKLAESVVDRRK